MGRTAARIFAALPLGDVTVRIEAGAAVVRRGRVRPALLDEIAAVATAEEIGNAVLHARTDGRDFHLRFFGIPPRLHQRFRNVWAVNGS